MDAFLKKFPFALSGKAVLHLLAVAGFCTIISFTSSAVAVVRLGSRGAEVMTVQRGLLEAGFYKGEINGIFGPRTRAAVIQFQRSRGLKADGIAGSTTLSALKSRPTQPISSGGRVSQNTRELQQLLKDRGFYKGEINGIFGPRTRAAVIQFQRSRGLKPDGIVGSTTLSALKKSSPTQPISSGGSFSQDTLELQQLLKRERLYNGNIDGIFGSRTEAALKAAQAISGLPVNGIVSRDTINALRSKIASRPKANPKTEELQRLLSDNGFYRAPIDGIYGSSTEAAVMKAQEAFGFLPPDGIVSPKLLEALKR